MASSQLGCLGAHAAAGSATFRLLLALLFLAAAPAVAAAAAGRSGRQLPIDGARTTFPRQGPAYAPGRLLVKLRPATGSDSPISGAIGSAGQLPGLELRASLAGTGGSSGGGSGRRLMAAARAVGSGQAVGLFAIRDGMSVAAKVAQIRRLPGVAWASPDRILRKLVLPLEAAAAGDLQPSPTAAAAAAARKASLGRRRLAAADSADDASDAAFVPNDPLWSALWHLQEVVAPHAWLYGMGSSKARICIIDTGMQEGHPDLPQPDDGWNGVPVVDSRGYPLRFPEEGDDDFHDWNDAQDHGSHVAGIATAVGNNSLGVTGLAWQAGLLVCRRPPLPPPSCSGTSMATPLVAAAAVQLAAAYEARTRRLPSYLDIKKALLATVDPFPDGSLSVSTGGQLNVARAMRLLLFNDAGTAPPSTDGTLTPADYTCTLQQFPGERWAHYTDSASFFQPLSGQTWEQCTQACISNLKCGKYVFFSAPAKTYIDGVERNCLLWSADAEVAWKEDNANVESGLVVRKLIPKPLPPEPQSRPRPPAPVRRPNRRTGTRPRL
ncbi:hypothetical protein ABPG75_003687 [Micractinium tetrahymenae]